MSKKKAGRNQQVTKQAKKLIDLVYCKGQPLNLAWKETYNCQYSKKRAEEVFNRPLCAEYIKSLQGDEVARMQASKTFLIEELVTRLKNAKDADANQMIRTLNTMLGYSEPEKVESKIQIIWKGLGE